MSKRLVTILWAIAGLLAALTLFVKWSQSNDGETNAAIAQGESLIEELPLKDVAIIKVEGADTTVTLKKDNEKGQWSVVERKDYKADFQKLTRLLRSLTEANVAQSKEAGPAFNERFGMDSEAENQDNHGYEVVISDAKGKKLTSFSVGKNAASEAAARRGDSGRYIRLANEPETVYSVNEPFSDLSSDPKDWLDGNFIAVSGIRSIKLTPGKDAYVNGWTISRSNAGSDFTIQNLAAGREPQADKLTLLKNVLSNPGFEDVLTAEEAIARRDETQANLITIKTFEGFEYQLDYAREKAGEKPNDDTATRPSYIVKVKVSADLPTSRVKKEGESEEQAKKADADFAERSKALAIRLKRESAFSERYYEVADYTLSPLDLGLDALAKPIVKTEAIAPTRAFGPLAPPPLDPPPAAVAPPARTAPAEKPKAPKQESSSNNSDALNNLTEEDIQRIIREVEEAAVREEDAAE